MHYVYLLRLSNKKNYTGSTKDLKKRIEYHNQGKVPPTKPYRPVALIYYEAYSNRKDARRRELFLKTGDGRQQLKKQLQSTLSGPFV